MAGPVRGAPQPVNQPCPDRSHSPRLYGGRWSCPDCARRWAELQNPPPSAQNGP